MSLTVVDIDENSAQHLAPKIINKNFGAIREIINKMEGVWNVETNKFSFSRFISAPAYGITAESIGISTASGVALYISPEGGALTYSVDADGNIITNTIRCLSETASSIFAKLAVTKEAAFGGVTSLAGTTNLTGTNAKLVSKISNLRITSGNVGVAAVQPIDISLVGSTVFIDGSNSGTSLDGSGVAKIKLGVASLIDGQEITIFISAINVSDILAFYNPNIFAKMTLNGIVDIANTINPIHDNVTIGAYLKIVYMLTAPTVYKLVITESKGFTLV